MKTATRLGSEWVGACVSSATLRSEDLIPAMLDVLTAAGHEGAPAWKREWAALTEDETGESIDLDEEKAGYLAENLYDAMDEVAPYGTSYESHEGDGACFGFWSYLRCPECGETVAEASEDADDDCCCTCCDWVGSEDDANADM